ncbi:MAG: CDP-alcohol phosphatidyltransferase family protein [Rhodothermales bacterium]|nr:CDP-alcohol phosphatidyltransferase family protein [Rhodothermales bacterium]
MEKAVAKERVNRIALARFEQWALPRMARRLPPWMTPDTLTVIGLVAAAVIGVSYVLTAYSLWWLWVASLGFVVHWWGDSLDGTLARVRDIRRERYGFYVDHQSDAISAFAIFVGLGCSPLMELPIALFMLVGYYLMMILVSLVTIARDVFKISFGGVGPTEARLGMIGANTLVFLLGNPTVAVAGWELTLFSLVGVLGSVLLVGYYVFFSLSERAKLAVLDPPPKPKGANGRAEARSEESVPEKAPAGSR